MLVRLNIGRRVGQIQDIEPSAAKAMIADGRASVVEYGEKPETEGVARLIAAADSTPADSTPADSTPAPVKTAKSAKK